MKRTVSKGQNGSWIYRTTNNIGQHDAIKSYLIDKRNKGEPRL